MRVFKKKVLSRNQPWKDKKRRRREISIDDDISQPKHIPLDLTLDIVSRLPAKSIVRYRSVSKLWSSFITLPSFIDSFESRSSSQPPRLLIAFTLQGKHFVFSFPQNKNPEGSYSPVYSYHMKDTYYDRYMRESVHGLILLYGFRIWNPSLRRISTLPHPREHIPISLCSRSSYLCYDPLEGKHKVLCLYYGTKSLMAMILTLGAQETWRIIPKEHCPMHSPTSEGYGRCFNGILYYEARVDDQFIIMSFDVKSESFSPIHYPNYSRSGWSDTMIPYEGRLALVTRDFPCGDGELYILKDAHGHEWTRQSLPRVCFKKEWRIYMEFKGITDAGEFIFAPRSFVDSFYILYFDPRSNTTREAFFEGFMGNEFRRSGHGVSNDRTDCLGVFANHMESLVFF
ncbi:putative F-box protein [Raphanus sativus]|uniref:F-box protein At1g50870 n=1 Tax=Raphanus sativus TaxID=3726 RepID=A0A6J0KQY0_RAPSA|nr:putative F-box protein At1g50870 [Raphanus sativus]KAJ4879874.1 putative F-box protein [Raphanus sativus]